MSSHPGPEPLEPAVALPGVVFQGQAGAALNNVPSQWRGEGTFVEMSTGNFTIPGEGPY